MRRVQHGAGFEREHGDRHLHDHRHAGRDDGRDDDDRARGDHACNDHCGWDDNDYANQDPINGYDLSGLQGGNNPCAKGRAGPNSKACKSFEAAEKKGAVKVSLAAIASVSGYISSGSAALALLTAGTPISAAFGSVALVAGGVSLAASALDAYKHPAPGKTIDVLVNVGLVRFGMGGNTALAKEARGAAALGLGVYWNFLRDAQSHRP